MASAPPAAPQAPASSLPPKGGHGAPQASPPSSESLSPLAAAPDAPTHTRQSPRQRQQSWILPVLGLAALAGVGAWLVATMLALGRIGPDTGADALWWPLLFRGVTTVMMFLPLSLATLGPLPREEVSAGSGFYNLTRQLGGSFGIAVLTLALDHQRSVHRAHLVESLTLTDPRLQERLAEWQLWLGSRASATGSPSEQALEMLSHQVDQQAALLVYGDVFRLVALLYAGVIPLVLLLGRATSPS